VVAPGEANQFSVGDHDLSTQASCGQLLVRDQVVQAADRDRELGGGAFSVVLKARCNEMRLSACSVHDGLYRCGAKTVGFIFMEAQRRDGCHVSLCLRPFNGQISYTLRSIIRYCLQSNLSRSISVSMVLTWDASILSALESCPTVVLSPRRHSTMRCCGAVITAC